MVRYAEGTALAKSIIDSLTPYLTAEEIKSAHDALAHAEPFIGAIFALTKAVYYRDAELPDPIKDQLIASKWGYTQETASELPLIQYALDKNAVIDHDKYPGFNPVRARELVSA